MKDQPISERLRLVFLCGLAYFMLDAPLQITGILPSYAGIKNFLPFTLGLFFGIYGVSGCILGCAVSALVLDIALYDAVYECCCIAVTGLGMFWGWHFLVKSSKLTFKTLPDYGRYIMLMAVLSALCLKIPVSASYFVFGTAISIPVNILFSSLLYIEPVLPKNCRRIYDAEFCLLSGKDSLDGANEAIEATAQTHGLPDKKVREVQSCIEELISRILDDDSSAKISVTLNYGEAISARLTYSGKKYNPFLTRKDENEIDIVRLKIIKHRAIRASFRYSGEVNTVHVVV